MRYLFLVLLSLIISPAAHAANDQLAQAAQLSQAGSPQLALLEVEAGQPAKPDSPDWLAWERLRLSLLITLGRSQDILRRTEQLPHGLPNDFLHDAYLAGAQAALKLGQGERARAYLARLMWLLESAADHVLARRLVLESYLAERRAADAYLVQLRYQQDFPQQDKIMLARTAELMLDAGMVREAVTWLPQLNEGPLKLLIRLEAGLMAPDMALAEARRFLQKNAGSEYWGVVLHAAQRQQNATLAQEARERLLNMAELPLDGPFQVNAQTTWKAYTALAQDVANQASLLVGDDTAWIELAARMAASSPVSARSLLVYLSGAAQTTEMRADAQNKFVMSLRDGKLGLAALRLFSQQEAANMAPVTRAIMGELANDAMRPEEAARYWHGLDNPPAGFSVQQWQLKRSAAFVGARAFADAEDAMRRLFMNVTPLPAEQSHAVLQLLLDMREVGGSEYTERLLKYWLPIAPQFQHKNILFALGDIAESSGQYETAARCFMQSIVLAGSRDPFVLTARLKAAANLAKAGLIDDARSQYRLLLNATKDKAQQEAIKRALAKL